MQSNWTYNSRPPHRRNDPSFYHKVDDNLKDIMKNLKQRHKKTVERKLEDGDNLVFDEKKGIVNANTGEVIVDVNTMYLASENDENEDIEGEELEHDEDVEEEVVTTFKDDKSKNERSREKNKDKDNDICEEPKEIDEPHTEKEM